MKVLAIFMTVAMLFTAFDLCSVKDADLCQESTRACETEEGHQQAESCSPFCGCTLCSHSIVFPPESADFQLYDLELKKFEDVQPGTLTQIVPSVWQPPKACRRIISA